MEINIKNLIGKVEIHYHGNEPQESLELENVSFNMVGLVRLMRVNGLWNEILIMLQFISIDFFSLGKKERFYHRLQGFYTSLPDLETHHIFAFSFQCIDQLKQPIFAFTEKPHFIYFIGFVKGN